jgi:hypothetical protein
MYHMALLVPGDSGILVLALPPLALGYREQRGGRDANLK